MIKSAHAAPFVLDAHTLIEHHAQYCSAAQVSFQSFGTMAVSRKRRFNRIGGSQR